jgi:hypothetical protein
MIARRFFVPWLVAGLALLAEPAKAIATAAEPDFDPATVYAIRFQPPGAGVMETLRGNWNLLGITLVGGSVGVRFARLVEAEVGATLLQGLCEGGTSLVARAGVSPSLLRARAEGTHWNLRLPLLIGYLNYSGHPASCDETPSTDLHAMLFFTGLDATHWSASAGGLNLRLLFSMGPAWVKDSGPYASGATWSDREWVMELGLTIGLVLR